MHCLGAGWGAARVPCLGVTLDQNPSSEELRGREDHPHPRVLPSTPACTPPPRLAALRPRLAAALPAPPARFPGPPSCAPEAAHQVTANCGLWGLRPVPMRPGTDGNLFLLSFFFRAVSFVFKHGRVSRLSRESRPACFSIRVTRVVISARQSWGTLGRRLSLRRRGGVDIGVNDRGKPCGSRRRESPRRAGMGVRAAEWPGIPTRGDAPYCPPGPGFFHLTECPRGPATSYLSICPSVWVVPTLRPLQVTLP